LNIPLGPGWAHPEAYGNPGELHRSQWEVADLAPYPSETLLLDFPCGPYGVFWCSKDLPLERRVESLLCAADSREAENDVEGALRHLAQARGLAPADERVALAQAGLLLRSGDFRGAADVLQAILALKPDFDYARQTLSRVADLVERRNESGSSSSQDPPRDKAK